MSLPGPTDVGVIVGRFQVPDLHAGHRKLFEIVMARHKRVLVLLGVPAWRGGIRNPMDFHTRKIMIESLYPTVLVSYINDRQTNEEWSADVDKAIRSIYPLEKVTLYGGRNGFTSLYTGCFPSAETLEDPIFDKQSGTTLRDQTASLPRDSTDFRAGVIYESYARPTGPTMCVDGAVVAYTSPTTLRVLLIRKPLENLWRFPGGRLDIGDVSLDTAAAREVREETGVEVGKPVYITSEGPIKDWRGEQSGIAIHSALFYIPYLYGAAIGGDDAAVARWFDLCTLTEDNMETCHKSFVGKLKTWVQDNMKYIIQYSQGGVSELSAEN